ncbi:hypothetical protein SAMN06295905_1656 [Devosia lucknowensis]|uniref:Beta/Gamma crystallin n=1 Tax=Devosia lucknowensis TaxID=1096929 RepID=A0A1Y6F8Q2_9HYPH|nr:hypothetical protein [Devosia lucknowensis]SMQ68773.1 hypothetical protein SAMN06295905_1656 [Devosia lucknowensis]
MKIARIALATALFAFGVSSVNALDRRVRINNYTSYDIIEFYASHTDASNWQEDILGRDILPAGSSVMINIDDGTGYCVFDFKAVFEDGEELEKYGNNVCELAEFNYTE